MEYTANDLFDFLKFLNQLQRNPTRAKYQSERREERRREEKKRQKKRRKDKREEKMKENENKNKWKERLNDESEGSENKRKKFRRIEQK